MTSSQQVPSCARTVLRVDAGLELVLAAGCVALGVVSPADGAWRSPGWLSSPVWLAIAAVLLLAAVALALLAASVDTGLLQAVGVANGVTAAVLLAGAVVDTGAGSALRSAVAVVGVALAALAIVQVRLARRAVRLPPG